MKNFGRFLFCLSILCVSLPVSGTSWAQVKGQYVPKPKTPEDPGLPPTVPRVFSSQVANVRLAEKLDLKLHEMTTVLKGYAEGDRAYRERMFELIQPYKFQITRRKEEFTKDIEDAKKALKNNYKKMKILIDTFEKDMEEQTKLFGEADRQAVAETGKRTVESFRKKSDEYFNLQADFIKTYSALVRFTLSNGGGYYYDSARKGVAFYNAGEYEAFAKMVDKLNKIAFDQVQLLNSFNAGPPI